MRNYTYRAYKIENSLREGILAKGDSLTSDGESPVHRAYLPPLDGVDEDVDWGRLHYEKQASGESIILVSVVSERYKVQDKDIPELFRAVEPDVNHCDILLYEHRKRYLYVMIEFIGNDPVYVSNIRVMNPGDNFLQTFPEIYRKRGGSFHRFLSIFSSIYNDFDWEIDNVDRWLDIEKVPVDILGVYMEWIGIHIDPNLPEEVHRSFLKEAYSLNCIKGTSESLRRVVKIVTGLDSRIIERSYLRQRYSDKDRKIIDHLFGESDGDVTVLIYGKRDFKLGDSLMFMLNQFKPVRVKLSIVYSGESGVLDSYSFMSGNAVIESKSQGMLDEYIVIGDGMTLG